MSTARYVHWQDGEMWLGYFEEFPDYLTQGETIEELKENLRDLYPDLTRPARFDGLEGDGAEAEQTLASGHNEL